MKNHTDRSLLEFANTINSLHDFAVPKANKTARTAYNLNKVANNVENQAFRKATSGIQSPEKSAKVAGSLRKMANNRVAAVKVAKVAKTAGKLGAVGVLGGAGIAAVNKMRKRNATK